ncbi:ABC transporter ATP-binding protein [Patulibacter sp.]|uniref:ABC transporter ATP-binding protein n=1 Tax=Patulibacter sp. TaxID=1912859 RepID=UPI00271D14F3|nr:ATP-binding cassette domain-containing protein [Patulibacter sp.]MDO9408943.1 ATP-binding cassette domain-containing protein [Patulibacter sp.]
MHDTAATTHDAVRLDRVTVRRHGRAGEELVLLDDVSWRVGAGEHWVVLGPNGAGKSTMLQLAGGVTHPTEGTVHVLGRRIGGVDLRALRERIGHVDAATARGLKRGLDGRDVVLSGAFGSLAPQRRRLRTEHEARADELLALTGSEVLGPRRFDDCSQGERQRLLLARALMAGGPGGGPDLLLLDEPASGLDLPSRERLVGALVASARRWPDLPTITVTHHLEEIPPTSTHALLLRDGRVLASGSADEVLASGPVSQCFGLPVTVERSGGRWAARMDPRG